MMSSRCFPTTLLCQSWRMCGCTGEVCLCHWQITTKSRCYVDLDALVAFKIFADNVALAIDMDHVRGFGKGLEKKLRSQLRAIGWDGEECCRQYFAQPQHIEGLSSNHKCVSSFVLAPLSEPSKEATRPFVLYSQTPYKLRLPSQHCHGAPAIRHVPMIGLYDQVGCSMLIYSGHLLIKQ